MKLDPKFIEEISQFETRYCLMSYGYHSTTSALQLKEHEIENVILVHNKTYLEPKHTIKTRKRVLELTNYKCIDTEPDLGNETIWELMKRSLAKIPEAMKVIEADKRRKEKKYHKHIFPCCKILKEDPGDKFFNNLKGNFVVIDSQCPYEGKHRRIRLQQIRNQNTFIRFLKSRGYYKAYPFRDSFKESDFRAYLINKGFSWIKHTGCVICPVLIAHRIYKEERYYNTLKAMAKANLPCFQKTMEDFIK